MSPVVTFTIAVAALRRNAMRTALTALGLIIGVAAVIAREVDGIRYISPGANTRQQIGAGSANWNTQIQGTGADLPAIRAWSLQYGSFFTQQDVLMTAKVA